VFNHELPPKKTSLTKNQSRSLSAENSRKASENSAEGVLAEVEGESSSPGAQRQVTTNKPRARSD